MLVFTDFNLSWFTSLKVKTFIKRTLDNFICSTRSTHLRKLKNLDLIISENHNDKAIYNDANIIFTEEELNLLSKGLRYSFFPSSINFKKVQAEFESLFSQIVPFVNSSCKMLWYNFRND